MSIKQQFLAYLVDASGKVIETLPIIAKNPRKDVEAMNGTCKAYTDGKLRWTLEAPQASQQLGLGEM
jgi:hypothetical protein